MVTVKCAFLLLFPAKRKMLIRSFPRTGFLSAVSGELLGYDTVILYILYRTLACLWDWSSNYLNDYYGFWWVILFVSIQHFNTLTLLGFAWPWPCLTLTSCRQTGRHFTAATNSGVTHFERLRSQNASSYEPTIGRAQSESDAVIHHVESTGGNQRNLSGMHECYRKICKVMDA